MTTISEFEQLLESNISQLNMTPGEIIPATVIDIKNDFVIINAGLKSEGIIPKSQFINSDGELEVAIGDVVEVTLDLVEDGYGETILSREKAKRKKVWTALENLLNNQEIVSGKVCGKVKGGFTVELMDVKAFLPGSLVDVRPTKETDYLEGKTLDFKIIKMDKVRNNIVLSRKAVLLDQNSSSEEMKEKYAEGNTTKGFVKNLTDYGAFIDLGGIDGLLHITDIAWKRINHPQEILKVGDEIDIKVLKFDQEKNRVSLGMKQLTDDPWEKVEGNIELNSVYESKVVNIAEYGVFVDLGDSIEGLIRTSELDWTNKNISPKKVLNLGDKINVKVIEVDEEKRRLSLSYKQCLPNPWEEFSNDHNKGDVIKSEIKSITDFGIFVGLDGGIDGLVHISDVTNLGKPEDFIRSYKKGNLIETVVLSIDAERERISLGLKQNIESNFESLTQDLELGSEISAEVVSVSDTGVYLKLDQNIPGSLKLLQKELREIVETSSLTVNQKIQCNIKSIDKKNFQVICTLLNSSE
ncbi:MAG: 30S ribosomal protein S1 [Gammaproteobacteria bacterium]|nr:30S ribosomal protein S1 [Gammaproteobacteria bacterium]MBL6818684.1 30S ribosomal protein S1 [Gammaproteobacteria bacterium]